MIMYEMVPDPLLAHGSDKVPDVRLREVLIIVLDQLGVNGGNGHEDVHHGSLGAQQQVPHLGGGREEHGETGFIHIST